MIFYEFVLVVYNCSSLSLSLSLCLKKFTRSVFSRMHTHVDNKIERKSVHRCIDKRKKKKKDVERRNEEREILGYIFHIAFDQKAKKKRGGGNTWHSLSLLHFAHL